MPLSNMGFYEIGFNIPDMQLIEINCLINQIIEKN